MNSKLQCLKNSGKIKRYVFYVIVIAVSVFLDQITKYVTAKSGKSYKIVYDILQIIPVKNNGMAFGMLGGWKYAQAFFITFTIIILALVGVYVVKTNNNDKTLHWAISLLIGGTLGNFIDRVIWREVRDFLALDLRIAILQFNCNVADIIITIGAVLLFVYFLFLDKEALFKNKKTTKQEAQNITDVKADTITESVEENTETKNCEKKAESNENAKISGKEISGELTGQKISGEKNFPLQEIKIEQDKDDENEN